MKTIAERLKFARDERGWSQSELATAAELSQSTIGNIEAGIRQSRGSLPKIAEALGISHKWLADYEGEMRPEKGADQTTGLSAHAIALAVLFDRLPKNDVMLWTITYNQVSQIIINAIQKQKPSLALELDQENKPAPRLSGPASRNKHS